MTDERYVAIQTSKERKNVANSAFRRKTHNGKGGCILPHEKLTKKERDAMNGEVESINLNEPIRDWTYFTSLSKSMQESYLWNLKKKYDPSVKALSEMFNVYYHAVARYFDREFPNLKPSTNYSQSAERRKKLKEFRAWAGIEKAATVPTEIADVRIKVSQEIHDAAKIAEQKITADETSGFKIIHEAKLEKHPDSHYTAEDLAKLMRAQSDNRAIELSFSANTDIALVGGLLGILAQKYPNGRISITYTY